MCSLIATFSSCSIVTGRYKEKRMGRHWTLIGLSLSHVFLLLNTLFLSLSHPPIHPCYWFSPTVCLNILLEHPPLLLPLTGELVWITSVSQACSVHTLPTLGMQHGIHTSEDQNECIVMLLISASVKRWAIHTILFDFFPHTSNLDGWKILTFTASLSLLG